MVEEVSGELAISGAPAAKGVDQREAIVEILIARCGERDGSVERCEGLTPNGSLRVRQ